jgi:pyridine nucleotide-disulfide oxidoreductase family protein
MVAIGSHCRFGSGGSRQQATPWQASASREEDTAVRSDTPIVVCGARGLRALSFATVLDLASINARCTSDYRGKEYIISCRPLLSPMEVRLGLLCLSRIFLMTLHRVLLAGAGHAHLALLSAWGRRLPVGLEVTLVAPRPLQIYSGMLPGWIAGRYELADTLIHLQPLSQRVGANVVWSEVHSVDPSHQHVALSDGRRLEYDLLSLDIGSETDLSFVQGSDERVLPIRPLERFAERWQTIMDRAREQALNLAVVGGGAAGVEIVLSTRHALHALNPAHRVMLVTTDEGVVPDHAPGVRRRARYWLQSRGIDVFRSSATGLNRNLHLADGRELAADVVIATTGARAPSWLRTSGLDVDEAGFVKVGPTHQSVSHANVFATGDACARVDRPLPRSGVHAVRAGRLLAHNLVAWSRSQRLSRYRPRKASLYLLSTGEEYAIASWGRFSAGGRWAWHWKRWIDRRYVNRVSGSSTEP